LLWRWRDSLRCRIGFIAIARRAEHAPTDKAPASGRYEQLNIFGTPTGTTAHVREGETLPAAPLGYTWRQIEDPEE
jgi:hypothetical protein